MLVLAPFWGRAQASKTETEAIAYYYWEGKVATEEVRLAFAQRGDVLIGEWWTRDLTQPLFVLGWADKQGEITFHVYDGYEFSSVGKLFTGRINGKQLDGFDAESQSSFKLKPFKNESPYAMDREPNAYCSPFSKEMIYDFDSKRRAGIYEYRLPSGANGHLNISLTGEDWQDVLFEAECYMGGARNYQAMFGGESSLDGDRFYYRMPDCDYLFEVRFFNGFVIVRGVEGSSRGCFESTSVTIEGIYVEAPSVG